MRGGPRTKRPVQGQCLIEGCSAPMRAGNLCNRHYLKDYFSREPSNRYERGRRWIRRNTIATYVSALAGTTIDEAHSVINATLQTIVEALKRGETVTVNGFGTFSPDPRSKFIFTAAPSLDRLLNMKDPK